MFDAMSFYKDYNISYSTSGNNVTKGWINTTCPFCDDRSNHLGYNLHSGYHSCWKCGGHHPLEVVKTLGGFNWQVAKEILKQYDFDYVPTKKEIKRAKSLNLDFAGELTNAQRNYIRKRKYDPDTMVRTWELKGTGPLGKYKHRIILPITYNDRLVSFTGRDFTNKSGLRYKSCAKEQEVIPHKELLYGIDKCTLHKAIVVEGPTDVWRFGPGAVGMFGITFLPQQVHLLAERFTHVFIMFDEGYQAQQQANNLGWTLASMGIIVELIDGIKGDPGDMPQEQADEWRKELLG